MANMKLNMETLELLREFKLIPRETDNDCLARILEDYKELKSRDEFERDTPEEQEDLLDQTMRV